VARGPNRRKVDRVPGERRRRAARVLALALPTVVALAGIVGAALGTWKLAVEGPALRIRAISFEGLSRATGRELLDLSPVQPGDHLLTSDLDRMEAALARHPWVETVDVRRTFPPALVVTVTERRAAALVDLGGLYLIDAHARVFKRAAAGDGLDLPVVTGISREDWVDRRDEVEPLMQGALALVGVWAERGLDARLPVAEIHVDPDFGTTLYAGDGGLEVRLGTGELPEKLSRLVRVLDALDADGREAEVVHLDNRRRPDWVTVRVAGRRGGDRAGSRGP
jgi:cell division protein FtsQ